MYHLDVLAFLSTALTCVSFNCINIIQCHVYVLFYVICIGLYVFTSVKNLHFDIGNCVCNIIKYSYIVAIWLHTVYSGTSL